MDNVHHLPKKEVPKWTHVCPLAGLITAPITTEKCKCGAIKNDKQDGAA